MGSSIVMKQIQVKSSHKSSLVKTSPKNLFGLQLGIPDMEFMERISKEYYKAIRFSVELISSGRFTLKYINFEPKFFFSSSVSLCFS